MVNNKQHVDSIIKGINGLFGQVETILTNVKNDIDTPEKQKEFTKHFIESGLSSQIDDVKSQLQKLQDGNNTK